MYFSGEKEQAAQESGTDFRMMSIDELAGDIDSQFKRNLDREDAESRSDDKAPSVRERVKTIRSKTNRSKKRN